MCIYFIYIYIYTSIYYIYQPTFNTQLREGLGPALAHVHKPSSLYGSDGRARGRPPNGPYTRIANAYTLTTTGEPKGRIRVKELIVRSTRNQRLKIIGPADFITTLWTLTASSHIFSALCVLVFFPQLLIALQILQERCQRFVLQLFRFRAF